MPAVEALTRKRGVLEAGPQEQQPIARHHDEGTSTTLPLVVDPRQDGVAQSVVEAFDTNVIAQLDMVPRRHAATMDDATKLLPRDSRIGPKPSDRAGRAIVEGADLLQRGVEVGQRWRGLSVPRTAAFDRKLKRAVDQLFEERLARTVRCGHYCVQVKLLGFVATQI